MRLLPRLLLLLALAPEGGGRPGFFAEVAWRLLRRGAGALEPVLVVLPAMHSDTTPGSGSGSNALLPVAGTSPEAALLRMLQVTGTVTVLRADSGNTSTPERLHAGRAPAAVLLILSPERPHEDLALALAALNRTSAWVPRAPHLLALPGSVSATPQNALPLLHTLWRHRAAQAAVLAGADAGVLTVWWRPFSDRGHCAGPEVPLFRVHHPSRAVFPTRVFSSKPLMDLHGCPVRVAAIPWTAYVILKSPDRKNLSLADYDGLDIRMLATISRKMSFSLDFLPDIAIDWSAAAEMVVDGRADLSVGAQYPDPNVFFRLDSTTPYWIDVVVWWVPAGVRIPRWMNVGLAFSLEVWAYTLLSIVSVSLTYELLRRVAVPGQREARLQHWSGETPDPFIVFIILLCISSSHQPITLRFRVVFIIWVLCSLILNTAYQCQLISSLTNPGMFPGIEDLEELCKSDLDVGVVTDGDEFFEWFMVDKFEPLIPRYQGCRNVTICLERAAEKHDMAVGIDKIYVEMMAGHFTNADGKFLLRYLSDIVYSFSVLMFLPKFGILQEGFDFVIAGLMQSGLVARWWDEVVGAKLFRPVGVKVKPLSVLHLQGAFVVLIGLLVIAVLVFVLEMSWEHVSYRCKSFTLWCKRRMWGGQIGRLSRSSRFFHTWNRIKKEQTVSFDLFKKATDWQAVENIKIRKAW